MRFYSYEKDTERNIDMYQWMVIYLDGTWEVVEGEDLYDVHGKIGLKDKGVLSVTRL